MTLTGLHADILDMAQRGTLTRRYVAMAVRPSTLPGMGYTFARAVRDLVDAGYLLRPAWWWAWLPSRTPTAVTKPGMAAANAHRAVTRG